MSRYPKCDQLRAQANSRSWSEILVCYCRQSSIENIQIAQQLNAVCARLAGVKRERCALILELETVGNTYAQKTAEYLREVEAKDEEKVTQMRILVAELELNARNNDVFIMKLQGLMHF